MRALNDGDYDEARALARECLGADPTDVDCHHTLLYSLSRKGEYGAEHDQAIDDCLAFVPDDPHCLEAKVLAEVHAKKIASAKEWLAQREALADHPPDYIGRALVAEAEGDQAAACEAYGGACRSSQAFACRMLEEKCKPQSRTQLDGDEPKVPRAPLTARRAFRRRDDHRRDVTPLTARRRRRDRRS